MSTETIVETKPRTFWGAVTAFLGIIVVSVLTGTLLTSLTLPGAFLIKAGAEQGRDIIGALPDDLVIDPLSGKTRIYAKTSSGENQLLATFYNQNREPVTWEEVSSYVKDAAVATEDPRFYDHNGVDMMGIARAAVYNTFGSSRTQGASTITQQYVKNVFIQKAEQLSDEKRRQQAYEYATDDTLNRKLREARLAIAVDKEYSKHEILLGYLNIIGFGGNVYGIEAAAKHYFGVSAKDLTLPQSATLVAIVNDPNYLRIDQPDSEKNGEANGYERTLIRRNYVLSSMLKNTKISQAQYDEAKETPVTPHLTNPQTGCVNADGAAYFCRYVVQEIKSNLFFGETPEQRNEYLNKSGLNIYTTLNLDVQKATEKSINNVAPRTVPGMNFGAASASVQPGTGRILAMAQNKIFTQDPDVAAKGNQYTSINYAADQAHGGSTGFQVGSTYKTFTLLDWLKTGHSLSTNISATGHQTFFRNHCQGDWYGTYDFQNYDGSRSSYSNVYSATRNSINTAYVEMAQRLDLCDIANMAENFGLHRADGDPLTQNPSAILGTNEVAPLGVATAFAGIAAGGKVCQPVAIDSITNSDGEKLDVPSANCTQIVDKGVAGAAAVALQQVITQGTGRNASPGDGVPMIGKTGTTDNSRHAWMSGATTKIATSVWTGNVVGHQNLEYKWISGMQGTQVRHAIFRNLMGSANNLLGGGGFPGANNNLL